MLTAATHAAAAAGMVARSFDAQLGCWCTKVQAGEFYITVASGTEAISTVLGSCVAACIRDPEAAIGGMNHFMLPEDTRRGSSDWGAAVGLASRYGSFAMESLINGLLKLGARRERLEVKLFGGGHVLDIELPVGTRNVEFAHRWLATEQLALAAEDTGGRSPRRIVYFPATGAVRVRLLRPIEGRDVVRAERQYLGDVAARPLAGEITLFGDEGAP